MYWLGMVDLDDCSSDAVVRSVKYLHFGAVFAMCEGCGLIADGQA
jgi:hypothetical protein